MPKGLHGLIGREQNCGQEANAGSSIRGRRDHTDSKPTLGWASLDVVELHRPLLGYWDHAELLEGTQRVRVVCAG
jgi:hypothetical protein